MTKIRQAAIREGSDGDYYINCTFEGGDKFAPIVVSAGHKELAEWIVLQLNREKPGG